MSIKINRFEAENVKRIKAVVLEPTESGLTIIGGKNNQGKTSVLDTIAWALGGEKYKPSAPQNEGTEAFPHMRITLSNGLIVERKGKNSTLTVTDPRGLKGGQQLLSEFVEQLALDLPRFMQASSKEKAETLLKIIGVSDKLAELERTEKDLYSQRKTIGQFADRKVKASEEMASFTGVPKEIISVSDLVKRQSEIILKNNQNQRKREAAKSLREQHDSLQRQIDELIKKRDNIKPSLDAAEAETLTIIDESTAEIESMIANAENINRQIRANIDKENARQEAQEYVAQREKLEYSLEKTRNERASLLKNAQLPLPGLSVQDGELLYNGFKWDSMSSSDQLKVSTAIVRKLNPSCGFVLMDKLEQMDIDTLRDFGEWLESEGLQVIATRVSTGDECSVIIEDGCVRE